MSPELLGIILVGFLLFFMVAGVWLTVRGEAAGVRSEFAEQSERMAAWKSALPGSKERCFMVLPPYSRSPQTLHLDPHPTTQV